MTLSINAYTHAGHIVVRVRAEQPSVAPSNPIHLAILLDISDSMAGDRLTAVKRTLLAARSLFQPTDRITLVTFGDSATCVANNHLMTADGSREFYQRVADLTTNGCTNLQAGITCLQSVQLVETPYTAILLLTDGIINRGTTSTGGLYAAMSCFVDLPITALGYGAQHNRTLLRNLAVSSHGSYTYVDTDELLPAVMGDLIAGLRNVVIHQAQITVGDQSYSLGDLVPGRDYWAVFKLSLPSPLSVKAFTEGNLIAETSIINPSCPDAVEQVFRFRASSLLTEVAEMMENSCRVPPHYTDKLTALRSEMTTAVPSSLLLQQLCAQITEISNAASFQESLPTTSLARLAAVTSIITTQRGVTSLRDTALTFSSPRQMEASQECQSAYSEDPLSPTD